MAYGTAEAVCRAPGSSTVDIRANRKRKKRHGRPTSGGASWPLVILFVGLQIADIVTTNYALAVPGIWEANPLMAFLQAKLGAIWWLPKLAVVGVVCVTTPLLRRRWPMILVTSYYAAIVSMNIVHL